MSLAPVGCAVQIHKHADKRGSCSPHIVVGLYLGTLSEHYRSHIIYYVKGTKTDRIFEIVFFKHSYLTNPTVTHADLWMEQEHYVMPSRSRNRDAQQHHGISEENKWHFPNNNREQQGHKLERASQEHPSTASLGTTHADPTLTISSQFTKHNISILA
jgi:hypothetical protein